MPILYALKWVSTPPAQLKDNQLYLYPDPANKAQWAFTFTKDGKQVTGLADNPLGALHQSLQHLNPQRNIVQFDYSEHYSIGQNIKDILNANFSEDKLLAEGKVQLANGMSIELAELYALMGDFFGIPDRPIAEGEGKLEQQERFIEAFDTLYGKDNLSEAAQQKQQTRIKNILLVGAIEKEALKIAEANCQCKNKKECNCTQKALEEVADMTNRLWNVATGGSNMTYPLSHSTYLALAKNNIDHFSSCAKDAYQAGHEKALAIIRQIRGASAEEQTKLIHKALAMEAAAGHFLTDLFSSGHVRVPRKALYNLKTLFGISVPTAITGIFTLVMHNEDGEHGVWVNDELTGEAWQAFGDATLFNGRSQENRIKAYTAARMGMLELVAEIRQAKINNLVEVDEKAGSLPEFGTIYKLLPTPCNHSAIHHQKQTSLNHPLFKMEDGKLKRRKDVGDPLCGDYIENWWVWSTFLRLLPKALAYAYPKWFSHESLTAKTEGQAMPCDKENPAVHSALKIYQEQKDDVTKRIENDTSQFGSYATAVQAFTSSSQQNQANHSHVDPDQHRFIDNLNKNPQNLLEYSGLSQIEIEIEKTPPTTQTPTA